tara:strand:- start:381 stop:725 length:345 start_codon:yes stop_codon:yes gene_type:complete
MIKLTNILSEMLNTYQVEANLFTDSSFNITDILNQIRAIRKITIVTINTPDDYVQNNPNTEYQRLKIKFVTRTDPKLDLEQIKNDILNTNLKTKNIRIPGIKSMKFKTETIKRL